MSKKSRAPSSRRLDGKAEGSDEEYFDEPDDEKPRSSSSRHSKPSRPEPAAEEEEEEDELDMFMAGIDKQAKKDVEESKGRAERVKEHGDVSGGGTGRDDIDQEDMQESYFK